MQPADARPTPPTTPADAANEPRAAHVVEVELNWGGDLKSVACPTLPDAAIISKLRDAVAPWRHYGVMARRLAIIRKYHALPGIAVAFYTAKRRLAIPPPLRVPFEPLELDEGHANVTGLIDSLEPAAASAARKRPIARWVVRMGIMTAILLPQVVNGLVQVIVHRKAWAYWLWGLIIGSIVLVGAINWLITPQWLLVPGGVVLRRSMFGRIGESLRRYTPADAVLVLRPMNPGWNAELWRESGVTRRRATDLEAQLLLAAWQNPLPPPDEQRLAEWR
ncbi:MAG: hypothetical protein AB7Q17_17695 [Phycisphaerae bacterium]